MASMNDNEDLEYEETDTTQRSERTLRWLRRLTAGVVAFTLVIIACTVIPLPYVARLPGPTVDVLGKTQDQQGDLKGIVRTRLLQLLDSLANHLRVKKTNL